MSATAVPKPTEKTETPLLAVSLAYLPAGYDPADGFPNAIYFLAGDEHDLIGEVAKDVAWLLEVGRRNDDVVRKEI